jgi:hypothetical protein
MEGYCKGVGGRRETIGPPLSEERGDWDTSERQVWYNEKKGGCAMADESCPKCKMPKKDWKAFAGNGYTNPKDGQKYCCRGCAEGGACTCK